MVTVFFLGGTISMSGTTSAVARLAGEELLASVPGLAELGVDVDVRDFRRMPSASFTFADLLELIEQAEDAAGDGVVVVQGTDTIEETAFLADLLWGRDVPLVVTGAMRTPAMAGADGPANLLAAITVAADKAAQGRGVLVVLNDEIHAARFVAKRHTASTAAFQSPDTGSIGRIVEGQAVFRFDVPRRAALARPDRIDARVPVLVATVGDDGVLLDSIGSECAGVVVAGFGVGHVPESWVEPLGALAERVPVVLASRIGAGPVLTHTYGAPGSETDLRSRGLITCGHLTAYQSRLLLLVLLSNGEPDVRGAFTQWVAQA